MRRAPLVIGGTIAGIAGVLAFPTHHNHLVIPGTTSAGQSSAGSTPTSATGSGGTTPTSASTTTAPSAGTAPSTTAPTTSQPTSSARHATGAVEQYPYGDLAVSVSVSGSKITDVTVTQLQDFDRRSATIDNYAIPQLRQQVMAANSASINGVSGATYTSQAYVYSVQSALDKLGVK